MVARLGLGSMMRFNSCSRDTYASTLTCVITFAARLICAFGCGPARPNWASADTMKVHSSPDA